MLIAIIGSRNFKNLTLVDGLISTLPPDTIVLSGGAKGVDNRAAWKARLRKLSVVILNANWVKFGKKAGFIRNSELVEYVKLHDGIVHAFWDGKSKGTLDTIHKCDDARIKIIVHREDGTTDQHELFNEEDIPF